MRTLKEAELKGKKVLLRADLDVPIKDGKVGEDYRLQALLPTLKFLHNAGEAGIASSGEDGASNAGAEVLILGHAGRPEGKRDSNLSLAPVAAKLSALTGEKITFLKDLSEARDFHGVSLLENLRFWPGEEKNDPAFAKQLAELGEVYINEAFAASHRNHASIVGIPKLLPAYGGLRLEQEVKELSSVLGEPEHPLIFILGGAKTETKMPLVPPFAKIADRILLGGLLMFDKELEKVPKVVFPVDAVEAYDIGPESIKLFASIIKEAKTVVWNGPLGVWEDNRYELGTRAIAEELALLPGKTIVGGGDTLAALSAFGLLEKMSYVSLGGGAMLEFLAGQKLPGLEALGYYEKG